MRIPSPLAAALGAAVAACAPAPAGAPETASAAAARCRGQPFVDVANPLPERAYIQLVTASGRTFHVDVPLAPKESRRIETPRNERIVRAYAATEAWRVERTRGRQVANASTTTVVEVRAGCAAPGARTD
jgi:hypothetical protein